MGVQSLEESVQSSINRSHGIDSVYKAIDIIKRSKFLNLEFVIDYIISYLHTFFPP